MKLRFEGGGPTVFVEVPVAVEPGQVFDAPADLAKRLLLRGDVVAASEPPAARPSKRRRAAAAEVQVPEPDGPAESSEETI